MDFGAGTLSMFRDAPQVSDVCLPTEEDKVNKSSFLFNIYNIFFIYISIVVFTYDFRYMYIFIDK